MISAPADVGDGEKSETKKVLIVNVAMTDEPKAVVSEGSMKEASINRRYLHDKGGTPPQTIHLNRGISSASTSGMISAPADVGDGEKSETKKVLIVNVAMTDEPKAVVSEGSMKEASINVSSGAINEI
ncbi:hypothetical protein LWI28_007560 [Acer negundo]|uniref:Uncharacterized protein n=1 Tax=Acer negundo TaxID=4023 RepID=A0AAD5NEF3_ACENE|nr:hypothetical protein LWI28_007560 [Acer negundo]